MSVTKPIKILHIVGSMNRGGIETWLMHVLRHIDCNCFHMDFLVHTNKKAVYDDEIRFLGSHIIQCRYPRKPWLFAPNFKRILADYGPYDIVHSHKHFYSGFILMLAKHAGVAGRIAHSHNDTSMLQSQAAFFFCLYIGLMKRLIKKYASIGLAGSPEAATALFWDNWQASFKIRILPYGIDLAPFKTAVDPGAVRKDFCFPPDALVIGHVGRFVKQKNHSFLLDIMGEVVKREPKARLLLIGDGILRPEVEKQAAFMGISDKIIFAGSRDDVPLMRVLMDVFLFPSLWEGLPLVLLEAQAAGLPCIFSDIISDKAIIVESLMHKLSLTSPPSAWAEQIINLRDLKQRTDHPQALAQIEGSKFNIQNQVKDLEAIYEKLVNKNS